MAPPRERAATHKRSPAHIRWIGRIAAIIALMIAAFSLWVVFAGLPAPLARAMRDAEYAPCVTRYAEARTARDSAIADDWVLRPRSRFTAEVSCGTMRRGER